VRQSDIQIKPS